MQDAVAMAFDSAAPGMRWRVILGRAIAHLGMALGWPFLIRSAVVENLLRDAQGRPVEAFEPGMILYRRGGGSVDVVRRAQLAAKQTSLARPTRFLAAPARTNNARRVPYQRSEDLAVGIGFFWPSIAGGNLRFSALRGIGRDARSGPRHKSKPRAAALNHSAGLLGAGERQAPQQRRHGRPGHFAASPPHALGGQPAVRAQRQMPIGGTRVLGSPRERG